MTTEEEIKYALDECAREVFASDFRSDRRYWTKAIKRTICNLGLSKGYSTRASGLEDLCHGEWLYDIVWHQLDAQNQLVNIPLIAESEWNHKNGEVDRDFQKLLQGKADIRLMIFENYDDEISRKIEEMKKQVEAFGHSQSGDRYLFAGLSWDLDEFIYTSYVKA